MEVYHSQPIVDAVIRFVENDPTSENTVKAMASGILNYSFLPADGYVVTSANRNNNFGFIILRLQGGVPGDRSIIHHTFAKAKPASDDPQASLGELEKALEHANTQFGRCWAIMIHGINFKFYEYHRNLPEHARLIPWSPPDEPQRNSFHARNDSVEIDSMLRHMAQNDTPPAR
ncbi:uncharacterized protein N7515_001061 [Penicillium bovifimosum]|uniref:Uncharacterized protein n=1 Tax=Penicillium bovifimosum TaxID=126998 RepID=A0A9W9HGJ4_9EURO|nr:uncharacterized protein N7515_001061 [Penicillium bovifimosum]KAJ5146497.1 hypothetical protein N7515_001061 [Penicillium bovifimosum]